MTAKPIKKVVKEIRPRRKYSKGEPHAPVGRPEKVLTNALFDAIMEDYTDGMPIRAACDKHGICFQNFRLKRDANEQFSSLYARAKPDKAENIVELGRLLSEVEPPMRGDGMGYDSAWVSWNNNRVNACFKAASLISPPTQKNEISGPGGKDPFVISVEVRK